MIKFIVISLILTFLINGVFNFNSTNSSFSVTMDKDKAETIISNIGGSISNLGKDDPTEDIENILKKQSEELLKMIPQEEQK
jgi:hypothetical protein